MGTEASEKYADKFRDWNLGDCSRESMALIRDIQRRAASIVLSEFESEESIADVIVDPKEKELVFSFGPFEVAFDLSEIKRMIENYEKSDDPDDPDIEFCYAKRKSLSQGSTFF